MQIEMNMPISMQQALLKSRTEIKSKSVFHIKKYVCMNACKMKACKKIQSKEFKRSKNKSVKELRLKMNCIRF